MEEEFLRHQIAFCNIDVEGHQHDQLMDFLAHNPQLAGRVIEANFSNPGGRWLGLNPLARFDWSPEISVQVVSIISAIAKIWDEESKSTPLLRRMLRNILFCLIEGRLSLLEAEYFLDLNKSGVRHELAKVTSNTRVQRDWAYFDSLTPARKLEQLGSSANRFAEFLDNECFKLVLGRTGKTLDIREVVEGRKTLLVNLAQGRYLSQDDAFLLGALIIALFVAYALTRDEQTGKERPFILACDEYQALLTVDAAKLLDQARKRGLHFIFSHQHMTQIADHWLTHSVLQNARTKLVFSLDDPTDLATFEEYLFWEHDLKRIKHQSYADREATTPLYWNLAELRYMNQKKIHELPTQHAYLKREGKPPQLVRIQDVQLYPRDESKLQELREMIWAHNPGLYLTEEEICAEQEARRRQLGRVPNVEHESYLDPDE